MPQLPDIWLMDACCAINLAASGQIESILRAPIAGEVRQFVLSEAVIGESGFLRRSGSSNNREQEPINWNSYFESGLLQRTAFNPESEREVECLAGLSLEGLGEGETECLAIGLSRDWGIVTDDTEAQDVARKYTQDISFLATPDLMKNWVDHTHPHASVVSATLKQIRERARYGPPRSHPFREWWIDALNVAP